MGIQGLQRVTGGYRGLLRVKRGYRGVQGVESRYKGLQGVTKGDKALQGVTKDYRNFIPDTFSWSILYKNQSERNLKFLTKTMD